MCDYMACCALSNRLKDKNLVDLLKIQLNAESKKLRSARHVLAAAIEDDDGSARIKRSARTLGKIEEELEQQKKARALEDIMSNGRAFATSRPAKKKPSIKKENKPAVKPGSGAGPKPKKVKTEA
jgi:hypothetical protein